MYTGGDLSRRMFLIWGALGAALLALPKRAQAFVLNFFPVRTVERDTFGFDPDSGTIKWHDGRGATPFILKVDGMVEKPASYTYREIKGFERVTQTTDFHCVEGWTEENVRWGGFRFSELLRRVKVNPGAEHVIFHSLGETTSSPGGQRYYIESHPLRTLMDPAQKCLMALEMNDLPLTHDHGAPMRLVAPFSLGYKNIKYVSRIEFAARPRAGWWTLANPIYPIEAPVPKQRLRK